MQHLLLVRKLQHEDGAHVQNDSEKLNNLQTVFESLRFSNLHYKLATYEMSSILKLKAPNLVVVIGKLQKNLY